MVLLCKEYICVELLIHCKYMQVQNKAKSILQRKTAAFQLKSYMYLSPILLCDLKWSLEGLTLYIYCTFTVWLYIYVGLSVCIIKAFGTMEGGCYCYRWRIVVASGHSLHVASLTLHTSHPCARSTEPALCSCCAALCNTSSRLHDLVYALSIT